MAELHLTLSVGGWEMLSPVTRSDVKPNGITLEDIPHEGIFYTQLKFKRFDISEMSFSSPDGQGTRVALPRLAGLYEQAVCLDHPAGA